MYNSDVTSAVELLIQEVLKEQDFSADIENQVSDAVESYFSGGKNREALVKEIIDSMNDEEFKSMISNTPSLKAFADFQNKVEKYLPMLDAISKVINPEFIK